MSFSLNIGQCIDRVLSDAETKEELYSVGGFTLDDLKAQLMQKSDEIRKEAGPAIDEFESAERLANARRAEAKGTLGAIPLWLNLARIALLLTILVAVGYLMLFLFWSDIFASVSEQRWANDARVLALSLFLLSLVAVTYGFLFFVRRRRESLSRLTQSIDADLGAKFSVADVYLTRSVQQNLRAIINEASRPFFQNSLVVTTKDHQTSPNVRITSGAGLSQARDASHEIATPAKRRLLRTLEILPGGSIGLAGARGVGKSSLLSSLCKTDACKIKGRTALSVYASAPVEYDARDFILYLYAETCRRVLRAFGKPNRERDPLGPLKDARIPTRTLAIIGTLMASLGTLLLIWAAILIATHRLFRTPMYAQLLFASVFVLLVGAYSLFFFLFNRRSERRRLDAEESPLVGAARLALRDIRFQISYSYGWSGSLKAVPGVETGIQAATQLAQAQKTLPEIVSEYRDFLQLVTSSFGPVVIGIDELDKMTSDETAQQFLNEIKVVFDVPECFYLVTISENAITAFERRGLPFRDAFDSAFDDVHYVRFSELCGLRSAPCSTCGLHYHKNYLYLAHALGAGLPRDVIRVTRKIC